jgi:hypothetical protein
MQRAADDTPVRRQPVICCGSRLGSRLLQVPTPTVTDSARGEAQVHERAQLTDVRFAVSAEPTAPYNPDNCARRPIKSPHGSHIVCHQLMDRHAAKSGCTVEMNQVGAGPTLSRPVALCCAVLPLAPTPQFHSHPARFKPS